MWRTIFTGKTFKPLNQNPDKPAYTLWSWKFHLWYRYNSPETKVQRKAPQHWPWCFWMNKGCFRNKRLRYTKRDAWAIKRGWWLTILTTSHAYFRSLYRTTTTKGPNCHSFHPTSMNSICYPITINPRPNKKKTYYNPVTSRIHLGMLLFNSWLKSSGK